MQRVGLVEAMRKYVLPLGVHCANFPWKETTSKTVYIFRNLQNRTRLDKIFKRNNRALQQLWTRTKILLAVDMLSNLALDLDMFMIKHFQVTGMAIKFFLCKLLLVYVKYWWIQHDQTSHVRISHFVEFIWVFIGFLNLSFFLSENLF